jgi:hypothetical protein
MRAMEVSIYTALTVFLLIIVSVFLVSFLFVNQVQSTPGGYTPPTQTGACKTKLDCGAKGICMSINGVPNFCGCFEDTDCGGLPSKCINNRCT